VYIYIVLFIFWCSDVEQQQQWCSQEFCMVGRGLSIQIQYVIYLHFYFIINLDKILKSTQSMEGAKVPLAPLPGYATEKQQFNGLFRVHNNLLQFRTRSRDEIPERFVTSSTLRPIILYYNT